MEILRSTWELTVFTNKYISHPVPKLRFVSNTGNLLLQIPPWTLMTGMFQFSPESCFSLVWQRTAKTRLLTEQNCVPYRKQFERGERGRTDGQFISCSCIYFLVPDDNFIRLWVSQTSNWGIWLFCIDVSGSQSTRVWMTFQGVSRVLGGYLWIRGLGCRHYLVVFFHQMYQICTCIVSIYL